MRPHTCPKCSGSMAEGYTLDSQSSSYTVSQWVSGAPVKSLFVGLKLKGKDKRPIETWRCGRCGYLENYAR